MDIKEVIEKYIPYGIGKETDTYYFAICPFKHHINNNENCTNDNKMALCARKNGTWYCFRCKRGGTTQVLLDYYLLNKEIPTSWMGELEKEEEDMRRATIKLKELFAENSETLGKPCAACNHAKYYHITTKEHKNQCIAGMIEKLKCKEGCN